MKKYFFILIFVLSSFISFSGINAQSNEELVNGFIKNINSENEKIVIHVVDNFGKDFKLNITTESEIGIETQSGERWVGTINNDQEYVVFLLEEAQHSLEPISIKYSGESINSLVSYESSNIKNNLDELGIKLSDKELKMVTEKVIELGDKKERVTIEDLPYIINDVLDYPEKDKKVIIDSYVLTSAKTLKPSTALSMIIEDKLYQETASGDGQFDAFMNALKRIYKSINLKLPKLIFDLCPS